MSNELTPYKQAYQRWETMLLRAAPKLDDLIPGQGRRLVRVALNQMVSGSQLLQATPASILGGMLESAQMGLEINTGGQCWLVPFKNRRAQTTIATLIIGYKGYIDLAYRTNQIEVCQAAAVYEKDAFTFIRHYGAGVAPTIHHEVNESELSDRGALRGAYMAAILKGASHWILHYLSRPEVMARKGASRAGNDSAWATHEAAMWRKSAIRAGQSELPHDYHFGRAVDLDTQADLGNQDVSVDPSDFGISEGEGEEAVGAGAETIDVPGGEA